MAKLTQQQREIAAQLIEDGWSCRDVASKLGTSPSTISRIRRRAAAAELPPTISPRSLPTDPLERLAAIRDGWLALAEQSQRVLLAQAEEDKTSTNHSIQAGIATQRAKEVTEYLDRGRGLPDELPDDDDDARKTVMRAWYRAARGGSPVAVRHLAHALGIRTAQQQPVRITFERPATENDQPAASPAASGDDPLLH